MIHDLLLILLGMFLYVILKIELYIMPPLFLKMLDDIEYNLRSFESTYDKEQIKKRAEIEFHLNNIMREANRSMPMNKSMVRTECIIIKNLYNS